MIKIGSGTYINESKIKTIEVFDKLTHDVYQITLDDGTAYNVRNTSVYKASIDVLLGRDNFERKYYELLADVNNLKDFINSQVGSINYNPPEILYKVRKMLGLK